MLSEILSVPVPLATRTYKPVSHASIIDTLKEELDKNKMTITNENYFHQMNGNIVTGILSLESTLDPELTCQIAFLNSYNKKKRAVIASGTQVRVCENGHILGDSSYGKFVRKHTGSVAEDILTFIPEMVKSSNDSFQALINQKEKMKEIEISKSIRNELIGQLYLDEAIIKDTQMTIIRKEFEKSTFDYKVDKNSLWHVYNNITVGLKTSNASDYIQSHQKLNSIIQSQFEIS